MSIPLITVILPSLHISAKAIFNSKETTLIGQP
jgi:hypothetical protein